MKTAILFRLGCALLGLGAMPVMADETATATSTAQVTATRTESGNSFAVTRSGSNDRGTTWKSDTTGTVSRTANGSSWTAETKGSNSKGGSWTADTTGTRTRNPDGSVTIDKDITRTNANGKTVTEDIQKTITPTANGATVTRDATVTTPAGTATRDTTTQVTRNADGSKSLTTSGTGTTVKGDTYTVSGHRVLLIKPPTAVPLTVPLRSKILTAQQ